LSGGGKKKIRAEGSKAQKTAKGNKGIKAQCRQGGAEKRQDFAHLKGGGGAKNKSGVQRNSNVAGASFFFVFWGTGGERKWGQIG